LENIERIFLRVFMSAFGQKFFILIISSFNFEVKIWLIPRIILAIFFLLFHFLPLPSPFPHLIFLLFILVLYLSILFAILYVFSVFKCQQNSSKKPSPLEFLVVSVFHIMYPFYHSCWTYFYKAIHNIPYLVKYVAILVMLVLSSESEE
jgi:hypothetical protein